MGLAKIIMKTSLYVLIVHIFQKSCGVEIDFETKLSLAKDKDAPTGPWYPNFLKAEYIKPCYKADPNLTSCALNTFNHLRPYLKSGIKELNVPSVDPLKIDYLLMENGKGPIKVKAAFYNITTVGATNYTVTHIKPDIENLIIEVGVHLPKLDITGSYDVNGNVLLFPVRSKGDFWAVFTGVEGAAKVKGKEYTNEQNVRFMIVDHMAVDFRLKKTRFRIKDVINHGNILGEAMNQFINNNAEEIIKEMKPAANIAIAKHFKEFLNAAFGQIPLKVWLPDA